MKIRFKEIMNFVPLIHNIFSLHREDEKGLLYRMNYSGDYYRVLSVLEGIYRIGCTVFAPRTPDGQMLLGRNFDLRHYYTNPQSGEKEITGLITVIRCHNPKARYESIGIADAIYLDPSGKTFHQGSFDHKDKNTLRALMLPFLTMDGVNEKGLAVSILHLNTDNSFEEIPYFDPETLGEEEKKNLILLQNTGQQPDASNGRLNKWNVIVNPIDRKAWKVVKAPATWQNHPDRKNVIHTVLMRMMLDNCSDCNEAVELAKSVNMFSKDSDNHILVTDTQKSVMLEWIDNELTVEECYHASNFYNNRPDHFGYGYNRDEVLKKAMETHPEGMSEEQCMEALSEASQNCLKGKDHGYTQWSAVYNLKQKTIKLCVHGDYTKTYSYSLRK